MSSAWLLIVAIAGFIIAYIFYGRFIAKRIGLERDRPTPAHTMNDGVDYMPAKAPVLLGHHFASIAGAAPIIGPVIAAVFGWIPVFLWIVLGGIFMGAVHDFTSLVASVRHQGRSIGEVIEEEIGERGKTFFLIFSWSTLILVVAVFAIVVANTFEQVPAAASASVMFILVAVLFGIFLYRFNFPLPVLTVLGVLLLAGALYLGYLYPLQLPAKSWLYILLGYIFVASVAPVWVLLQPRDYLNSFILYALMGLAVAGIFFVHPDIQLPTFTTFHVDRLGYMFPILFVTVACGAISGFHSLVSSGTTAKQLNRETDARMVGFGSMLVESVLAVVALISAAVLLHDRYTELLIVNGKVNPVNLFSTSLASIFTEMGIDFRAGKAFVSLAVSAFALTSLDTATRLSRFAMQEFFHKKGLKDEEQSVMFRNRYITTAVCVAVAAILIFSGHGMSIWPIFGSANQLLAALALLSVTVWLTRNRRGNLFVRIPMVLMFIIALSALAVMIYKNFSDGKIMLAVIAVILFIFAIFLVLETRRSLKESGS